MGLSSSMTSMGSTMARNECTCGNRRNCVCSNRTWSGNPIIVPGMNSGQLDLEFFRTNPRADLAERAQVFDTSPELVYNTGFKKFPCYYLNYKTYEKLKSERAGTPLQPQELTGRDHIILYFHGNGEDLGQIIADLYELMEVTQCSVIAPEYPGYGVFTKELDVENPRTLTPDTTDMTILSRDLIRQVKSKLGFRENQIIIMGRSIGTGPASIAASEHQDIKSLILVSPFTKTSDIALNFAPRYIQ